MNDEQASRQAAIAAALETVHVSHPDWQEHVNEATIDGAREAYLEAYCDACREALNLAGIGSTDCGVYANDAAEALRADLDRELMRLDAEEGTVGRMPYLLAEIKAERISQEELAELDAIAARGLIPEDYAALAKRAGVA